MQLPEYVNTCMAMLEGQGFDVYAVGGCVRDYVLNITPHDYDLCTSASPDQICEVFHEFPLVKAGAKHGTIGIVINGQVVEITTFRSEGTYSDHRHPQWVSFVKNIEEDLARRDFTINALAYSPQKGLIDPFNGCEDLNQKLLRAVGEPDIRFREDALRILRGIRFAARFGLRCDSETRKAMDNNKKLLGVIAKERIYEELCGILLHANHEILQEYQSVLSEVIPELRGCAGFDQHSTHHKYDVLTHMFLVVEKVPGNLSLRWAALLHDLGKPMTFTLDEYGNGHFYGHALKSAELAETVLTQLKAPTAIRETVRILVQEHMNPLQPDIRILRRRVAKYGYDVVNMINLLQKADMEGTGINEKGSSDFDKVKDLLEQLRIKEEPMTVKSLKVNGSDLIQLGIPQGKQIGNVLNMLLNAVMEDQVDNNYDSLVMLAKKYIGE